MPLPACIGALASTSSWLWLQSLASSDDDAVQQFRADGRRSSAASALGGVEEDGFGADDGSGDLSGAFPMPADDDLMGGGGGEDAYYEDDGAGVGIDAGEGGRRSSAAGRRSVGADSVAGASDVATGGAQSALGDVMGDDLGSASGFDGDAMSRSRRSSRAASSLLGSSQRGGADEEGDEESDGRGGKPTKAPKRKMVIDGEIQLSNDQIRHQLNDTSRLVRRFDDDVYDYEYNQPGASDAGPSAAAPVQHSWRDVCDAFYGPPPLPYLPASLATMGIFTATGLQASQRAAKRAKSAAAASAGAGSSADGEGGAEGEAGGRRGSVGAAGSGSAAADEDAIEEFRSGSERGSIGVAAIEADAALAGGGGRASELGRSSVGGMSLADGEEESFAVHDDEEALPPAHDDERASFGGAAGGVGGEDEMALDEEMAPVYDEEEAEEGEQPAGFAVAGALPDVDDNMTAEAGGGDKGGESASPSDAWSARTAKMHTMLRGAFDESDGQALSYFSMAKKATKEPNRRKIIAGCFQELLFLTTHGMIELEQRKPYRDLLISKTELFDKHAKKHAKQAATEAAKQQAAAAAAAAAAQQAPQAMQPPPPRGSKGKARKAST